MTFTNAAEVSDMPSVGWVSFVPNELGRKV